jgi:DNA-directed RNA polymerase subunit RPC12/RpoP
MTQVATASPAHQFPCRQCGAAIEFSPGAQCLTCPHCGASNEIPTPLDVRGIEELDYLTYAQGIPSGDAAHETLVVKCNGCGAETTLAGDAAAGRCQFCGSPVIAESASKKSIKPGALLPFAVTRQQADAAFHAWIAGLWFAPSGLAKQAGRSGISGVYIPCWTYDANTVTEYTGMRGDDYQEMETYTQIVNGQPQTCTRMVTRTSWRGASGVVRQRFDDVLVLATGSLPMAQAQHLQPWDLKNLVPYADEYLSGFACQTYQIDRPSGFEQARAMVEPAIRHAINRDIGGNHQRISSMQPHFMNVTFKHILLPLWISAYLYQGKTYRFLVNARTGAVKGERPFSAVKIALLVAALVTAIVVIALIVTASQTR